MDTFTHIASLGVITVPVIAVAYMNELQLKKFVAICLYGLFIIELTKTDELEKLNELNTKIASTSVQLNCHLT